MVDTKDRAPPIGEVVAEDATRIPFTRATVAMVITNPNIRDNPIVYVNEAFSELTGYAPSAVIGRNCRFLQGGDTDAADVARLRAAIERKEEVATDLLNYRADGEAFLNRLVIAPVFSDTGRLDYFLGIQKEMTQDDMELPDGVSAGGEDGELISEQLRQIQGRVKSHLSMIIALIRMQGRGSTAPEEFDTLSRRIETLQFLYEEMIRPSPDGANDDRIALGAYLSRVGNAIAHMDGRPGIRVNVDATDVNVDVDSATRIGLLASELLTNAMRHAFEGRHFGSVELRIVTLAQGGLRLLVADDGIGIPRDVAFPSEDTLGGRIVARIVEGLEGSLNVARGAAGTVVTADIPQDAIAAMTEED